MPDYEEASYDEYPKRRRRKHRNRRRRHRRHRRRRRSSGFRLWHGLIIFLLLLIVSGGVYVYKVYEDVKNTSAAISTSRPQTQIQTRETAVEITETTKEHKPFSVLLLGIDTGDLGRIDQGRSDVMMVVTVNPNTNATTITSIPRDTLTEIVGHGTQDKINHAYAFGGVGMAVNSVQNLLGIPIDFSVMVNMQGFSDVVDAVGGITITPSATFEQRGYQFVEGQTRHMYGEEALAYSQNRYDSGGDYGRQDRQREMVEALLHEVIDVSLIYKYDEILHTLKNNVQTDLTFSEILTLSRHYTGAAKNIETYQLSGHGEMIDGVYYEIIEEASLNEIKHLLESQLEI